MVGISKNLGLQIAPSVTNAMSVLSTHAGYNSNSAGYIPGVSGPTGSAANALSSLTTIQGQMGFTGNPSTDNHAGFGQILNQAQNHISDAQSIQTTTSFISNSSYSDFGSGITNMSSMSNQGLVGSLGNLSAAGNAFSAAGPVFDLTDMSNFGTGAGLVNKLSSVKLGNATGVNAALTQNNVDLNNLSDPSYSDTITQTLSSINDPTVISTVTNQLGISPPGNITNLNDLTDINKLANPNSVSGLTGGLSGMSDKFSDMGAKFTSPTDAASMMNNIQVPSIPTLDTSASDLSAHMTSLTPSIQSMTGVGVGVSPLLGSNGLPSMQDFTHVVSGGPELSNITSPSSLTAGQVSALSDSISKTSGLMDTAGIDLTSVPTSTLSTNMSFATNLHKFGVDSTGSGVSDVLNSMAVPNSIYGDSIKNSLAEGKNISLMQAQGINPLKFS